MVVRVITHVPENWRGQERQNPGSYFNKNLLEQEREHLFQKRPLYMGHRDRVVKENDYCVLPATDNELVLTFRDGDRHLLVNSCTHAGAILLGPGRKKKDEFSASDGNVRKIVCANHSATFSCDGESHGIAGGKGGACSRLGKKPLQEWNGLLFSGSGNIEEELAPMESAAFFDARDFEYDKTEVVDYNFNWKTGVGVFEEVLHVLAGYHRGNLNELALVTMRADLLFEFGETWDVQVTEQKPDISGASGKFKEVLEQFARFPDETFPHGAGWLTIYPNITIERYPHVLVVSIWIPTGTRQTRNVVEFYYHKNLRNNPEFREFLVHAYPDAYNNQTAVEDKEICEANEEGSLIAFRHGTWKPGPYIDPFETGQQHFDWWCEMARRRGMQSPEY